MFCSTESMFDTNKPQCSIIVHISSVPAHGLLTFTLQFFLSFFLFFFCQVHSTQFCFYFGFFFKSTVNLFSIKFCTVELLHKQSICISYPECYSQFMFLSWLFSSELASVVPSSDQISLWKQKKKNLFSIDYHTFFIIRYIIRWRYK